GRVARLEELGRASRARCIARWKAAGLGETEACTLADDPSTAAPDDSLAPSDTQPLVVLVGEFGAGKSTIAERLFQRAIARAKDSADAPIPFYLEAMHLSGQLAQVIEAGATGLGDPHLQGVFVVIDG